MNNKSIKDLPKDIYDTLAKGVTLNDNDIEWLCTMLKERLAPRTQKKGELRMSNFGTPCDRRLWFLVNYPEQAEELDGKTRFKFLYGDIIECLVTLLAEKAGHSVVGEQDEIEVNGVVGHRDGIFDGMVGDVKSAGSFAFKKFKENRVDKDDPFGYIDQLSLYMEGSKDDPALKIKKEGAFIAVNKETGEIVVDIYRKKDVDYASEIDKKRELLASATPPPRPYDPMSVDRGANFAIPVVPCSYCQMKQICWKDANGGRGLIKVAKTNGPQWYVGTGYR